MSVTATVESLTVRRDLLSGKGWYSVDVCFSDKVCKIYLIAKHLKESQKSIVIPIRFDESISPKWVTSLFEALTPPGDLDDFEEGLLLGIVGDSTSIVYHRIMPGITSIARFPKMKGKHS